MLVRGCLTLLVVASACATGSLPPPAPARQTNLGLQISNYALPNGLRVVLVRDPRAAEVQVTMRYRVGSVDDPPEQAGVAHVVEHLMFQQVLGAQSLFARLEGIATSFNASTTQDATTYVARAHAKHLDALLSVEAVRVGFRCTSITDSVFLREREVVLNELRQRDYASEVLSAIHAGVYPAGHPYRRSVGGSEDTVGALTRKQACAFADAHYAPGNAVLVVSGDITEPQLEASLNRFLARVAKRPAVAPAPAAHVGLEARTVKVPAPIDDAALMIAWRVPADPQLAAMVRAVATATQALVDGEVRGQTALIELGDTRAPMIAVFVFPSTDETMAEARAGAERGIANTPLAFRRDQFLGDVAFNRIQQSAIYRLFTQLEDGSGRDARLAGYVLAGRDPRTALGAEIQGLRNMTPEMAAAIARQNLSLDHATVVVLEPSERRKRGHGIKLATPIHDLGQRRDPPDPAAATTPIEDTLRSGIAGVQTRELPNGLTVVLLPLTSVPTVEIRLVFGAGTADDPSDKRGSALIAGYALTWDMRHLNDYINFAAAGGTQLTDVGTDHTSFGARGLDMHLDLLMAGLRRLVRDGTYRNGTASIVAAMRVQAKTEDDHGALTDAWHTSLFGGDHPYVRAGLMRHNSAALDVEDAKRFRAAHYTPDNATLVISGRFDPALADRWVDYLFADWTGRAELRLSPRVTPLPRSLARVAATAQTQLLISLPSTVDRRPEELVAAAMLSNVARDVRHQLGASYGLDAQLAERRLATTYQISGWIDAARAADALELLRSRLDALRTDPDTAARSFVTARQQVLNHLISIAASASTIANDVELDVALQRAPMSGLKTAAEVQRLTIATMASALAELDLARATVLMTGPEADLGAAFAVLGRTPTYLPADPPVREDRERVTVAAEPPPERLSSSEYTDALTEQGPPNRLTFAVAAGAGIGFVSSQHTMPGLLLQGRIGYRVDRSASVGLYGSLGRFSGTYDNHMFGRFTENLVPIDADSGSVGGFLQATGYERLWGAVTVGINVTRIADNGVESGWANGLGFGLQSGVDIVKIARSRFGAFVGVQGELLTDVTFAAVSLGVAYRH